MGALSDCIILDFPDEKSRLCVKTLSGLGASVLPLKVASAAEQMHLRDLIKTADILVESYPPGYLASFGLGYENLSKLNPRLIMVSITHFGQDGPYKDFKSCDLVDQALGGWLSVTGEPEKPLKLYGNQAYNTASLFAVNGILLALWQRRESGKGQYLDIAITECVAATLDYVLVRYFYENVVSKRQGSRHWHNAFRVFPCKDGYVLLTLHHQWDTLVELMAYDGMAGDLTEERWRDRRERDRHIDHIIEIIEEWTSRYQASELEAKGQLMHFPWAEVRR